MDTFNFNYEIRKFNSKNYVFIYNKINVRITRLIDKYENSNLGS